LGFRRHRNRRRAAAGERATAVKSLTLLARKLARVALVCTVTCGLGLGGYSAYRWLRTSPRFALKAVTFRGLRHANEHELCRIAGLFPGLNLFAVDVATVQRAMTMHPWVERAEVARIFPSSLSVSVKEHVPVAVVVLGELYLIDSEGRPFKKVHGGEAVDLPLLTGLQREQFVDAPDASRLQVLKALEIAAAYGKVDPSPLSEIRLSRYGLTLVTGTGQELHLGEGEIAEKLARLKEVRAELERRGLVAQVIYLENRARPNWIAAKVSTAVGEGKTGVGR
jgi:cell division protein FtsQ